MAVKEFATGIAESVGEAINPFNRDKRFTREELKARGEEFSNPEYMWENYYTQRRDLEDTNDAIAILERLRKMEIMKKSNYISIEDQEGELTDEAKQIISEMDQDLQDLELQKKLQLSAINYAHKNLGGIQKHVTAPLYDVIVDVSSINDVGDLISAGRIAMVAASAGIGAGVAAGTARLGMGTVGKVLATEAVVSIGDTALDVARVKDDTGQDLSVKQIAGMYGVNFATGVGMEGVGAGVGYAFGKIFPKAKAKINKTGAKVVNSQNAPINEDGITPNPTVNQATKEALNKVLGTESAEQMSDVINQNVEIKFDNFETNFDGKLSNTLDIGATTSAERKVKTELAQGLESGKKKKVDDTTTYYKQKEGLNFFPGNKSLGLPDVGDTAVMQAMNLRSNKIRVEMSNVVANFARNTANVYEEAAAAQGKMAKDILVQSPLFTKEFVNSISIMKEAVSQNTTKEMNFKISSLGSNIGIYDFADFVDYSLKNEINVMESFFLNKLPKEMPQEYKDVWGFMKDLTYKYSIEVTPRNIFEDTDPLVQLAGEYNFKDLFIGTDYKPDLYEGSNIPMMINPSLTKEEALKYLDVVKKDIKNKILDSSEEVSTKIDEIVQNFTDAYFLPYNEELTNFLLDNLGETKSNLVNKLTSRGLSQREARTLYNEFNKARREFKVGNTSLDLAETIISDFQKRNTIKNRIFAFVRKDQAQANADLFRVTKDAEGTRKTIKEWASEKEVKASREFTQEELDRRDAIVDRINKIFGKNNPAVKNAYTGVRVPLANGRSKIIDINSSVYDYIDIYWKENGIPNKDWRDLSKERLVQLVDEIALDLHTELVRRVGNSERIFHGIADPESLINKLMTNWKIDPGKVEVKINYEADKFEGFVQLQDNGKYLLNLDFTKKMDVDTQLGVVRHEMQHIYDNIVLGAGTNASYQSAFRNIPTVKNSPILREILRETGFTPDARKPITLRRLQGEFYDNHFYSYMNSNFENKYLYAMAREAMEKRTGFQKAQDFFQLLYASTQNRTGDRVPVSQIFGFVKETEPFLDELPEDFYQDYLIKSFVDPEQMYKFVDFLADTGNNKTKNLTSQFGKIISRRTTEELGFSINTLMTQLNKSQIQKDLVAQGIADQFLNNTVAEQVITQLREGVKERFLTTGSRDLDILSPSQLASSGVTSALIGARHFVEALTGPVMAGVSNVLNGGNFAESVNLMIKNYPLAYKNYFKSYGYATGTIIESGGQFWNMTVNAVTQTLLGKQYEQNLTAHIANVLHKNTNIANKNISLFDAKLHGEFMTKMSILNAGKDPESFLAGIAKIFNRNLHGNKADDVASQMIGQYVAKSDLMQMLNKSGFAQLNERQKKMYSYSGFTNQQFTEWQEYARGVIDKHGMDKLPQEAFALKMMLSQAEGAVDIMGMSRRTSELIDNPFFYMCKTMINAADLAFKKLKATNIDGIPIDNLNTNMIIDCMKIAGLAGIGVIASSPRDFAESIIFGNKNLMDKSEEVYEKFQENPAAGAATLAKTLIEEGAKQTPFAYATSPSSNAFGYAGAGYSLIDRNIYDFSAGEFRGKGTTLRLMGSAILGSTTLKLGRESKDGKVSKSKLLKQGAKDIETYLPIMYNDYTTKARRKQKNSDYLLLNY